jgi:hypothetical protein
MAQQGINYFYTGVLGLNQDSLRVFYDFKSGDSNHILSVPIGNAENSGQILGNSGDFFGGISSGNFANNGVKIANSTGLFSQNATFIVTQEKTGINGGTIFSNFEGSNFKSGYYFGINDANKFYWGYQDDQSPIIKTALTTLSDKNAFAVKLEENNVSFCYYNNNTLQFEKSSWGINSDTLLPSDQWYLGTGKNLKPYDHSIDNFIYIDRAVPDSSLVRLFSGLWNESSGDLSGYLPYETGQITGYTNTITGVTGILSSTQEFSGNVTGTSQVEVYQFVPQTGIILEGGTEIEFLQNMPQFCTNRDEQPIYWKKNVTIESTGVTGVEKVFSGFTTINEVTPVYKTIIETGFVSSGEILQPLYNTGNAEDFVFSGSVSNIPDIPYLNSFGMKSVSYLNTTTPKPEGVILFGGGNPFVSDDFYEKTGIVNSKDAFYNPDNPLYRLYYDPSFNGGSWRVTANDNDLYYAVSNSSSPVGLGYQVGIAGTEPSPQVKRSIDGFLFESLSSTGSPLQTYYNKLANYNFGNLNFQTDRVYNSGYVDVFLNGLIQSTGGYSITGEFFNAGVEISGDYFISGKNIYFKDSVSSSDILLYDVNNSGSKEYFESGDYSSSGTLPILVDENLIFLNGRKLISGFDYSGINGFFAASEGTQAISGQIRTIEIRNNQSYLSNPVNYLTLSGDIITISGVPITVGDFSLIASGQTFLRDTSINWLNGVRLNRDFLEHGSIDLLDGSQISKGGVTGFFNNNTDFWA